MGHYFVTTESRKSLWLATWIDSGSSISTFAIHFVSYRFVMEKIHALHASNFRHRIFPRTQMFTRCRTFQQFLVSMNLKTCRHIFSFCWHARTIEGFHLNSMGIQTLSTTPIPHSNTTLCWSLLLQQCSVHLAFSYKIHAIRLWLVYKHLSQWYIYIFNLLYIFTKLYFSEWGNKKFKLVKTHSPPVL